jgi:hypothetical protein
MIGLASETVNLSCFQQGSHARIAGHFLSFVMAVRANLFD